MYHVPTSDYPPPTRAGGHPRSIVVVIGALSCTPQRRSTLVGHRRDSAESWPHASRAQGIKSSRPARRFALKTAKANPS